MAARRPVVVYPYGALPELIDDGETGLLASYLDLSGGLERLRSFAEPPPTDYAVLRNSARSRRRALFARRIATGHYYALRTAHRRNHRVKADRAALSSGLNVPANAVPPASEKTQKKSKIPV